MRYVLRIGLLLVAVALIAWGMFLPIEADARWIGLLWLAAPLLFAAVRMSMPELPRGISRSVTNLGIFISVGFVLLSMQLLRQQFVRASEIANYVYIDPQTGQATSNVRPVIASQRIQRGQISDRNGIVIVGTEVTESNYARRVYPLEEGLDPSAFSNLTGYFSLIYGQTGLEASYSDYLTGQLDHLGRLQNSLLGTPQVGDNLQLTLDAHLQQAAQNVLGDRSGSVVVLDPKTGAILAMATAPTFDPRGLALDPSADRTQESDRVIAYWASLNSEGSGQPLLNRPIQGRYPPGSTYKTVTAVGVLEQNKDPNTISCPNQLETESGAPAVVNAVDNLGSLVGEPATLERVYAYSCNTAFAQYALRLEAQGMIDTAAKFDIFTPLDVPDSYTGMTDLDVAPSLLYRDSGFLNRAAAVADTGYGQGQLQVTPLQMAMVAASIANDGMMMRPYLVDRITRPNGDVVVANTARVIRRTMSQQTAATMRANMRAVAEYGFGKSVQDYVDPNVALVGGKSGTAEHGDGLTPHAWFIAVAPIDNPRYAVAVMIENGGEGSSVGAQAAGEVLRAAFELEK